jgi:hypothetical protein
MNNASISSAKEYCQKIDRPSTAYLTFAHSTLKCEMPFFYDMLWSQFYPLFLFFLFPSLSFSSFSYHLSVSFFSKLSSLNLSLSLSLFLSFSLSLFLHFHALSPFSIPFYSLLLFLILTNALKKVQVLTEKS